MTQQKSQHKGLTQLKCFVSTLPGQSVCWLISISLLSGGVVFGEDTPVDNIIPPTQNSPQVAVTDIADTKVVSAEPTTHSTVKTSSSASALLPLKEATAPFVQVSPQKTEIKKPEVENSSITFSNESTEEKQDDNKVYSHSTDYSDSTASRAKLHQDTTLADNHHSTTPSWLKKSLDSNLAKLSSREDKQAVVIHNISKEGQKSHQNHQNWRISRIISNGEAAKVYHLNRFIPSPSEFATTTTNVSVIPTESSISTLPIPVIAGNIAPRPSTVAYDFSLASVLPQVSYSHTVAYQAGSGIVFPLSIPAPVTSLFGWRVHPITGDRRFHAGTDLGAPIGTPVLAAARGQVETADWMGGYGLAVIINHNSAEQSLYGHMSQIFVHPGQWVEPGTVIGQVGSTGFSTGPHLHFEIRHLTPDGWVAIDPGVKLQASLGQLTQSLRTAPDANQLANSN